jgi:hypothetical protein
MEILSTLAIPAVVKFFDLLNNKEYKKAGKIVLAVATGIAAGAYGIQGLDPVTGAVAGLSASGLVTIAGYKK